VDEAQLRRFLALHTAYFDLLHRTPALARIENGGLLLHIAQTLEQGVEGRAVEGAVSAPDQKLVVLVGHDTNLAGLAALLGLHWTLDRRNDDTPPDTELAFQLWQTASGKFVVRMVVTQQTLPQLREGQTLSTRNPPASEQVDPAGCAAMGTPCSWESFFKAVTDVTR
jgi:4-phytase/acid phosphatase